MGEKILALLENYFFHHNALPILMVVPFIVGLVSLFISGRRVRGLMTMVCSVLYSCAVFGMIYGRITIKEMAIFAAIAICLSVIGWVKFHHFSGLKCFLTLLFYPFVIAGFLVVAPLIEKEEIWPFIQAITSAEWLYIIFFACLGIWAVPYVFKIVLTLLELADLGNVSSYSNYDGTNGATGDEDVTK